MRACPELAEGARSRRVDPLCCPRCGGEMKIISFITDPLVIQQILEHLGLWAKKPSRDPPNQESFSELVYETYMSGTVSNNNGI